MIERVEITRPDRPDRRASDDPAVHTMQTQQGLCRLVTLADDTSSTESSVGAKADIEQFLEGLRHAREEGEVRPTSRRKPPVPRGRRRPDPLARAADDIRAWFDEDPSQTGRDLLCRLQAAHPDAYPDGLLRSVSRRLKIWRAQLARDLVFGDSTHPTTPDALRNLEAPRVRGRRDQPGIPVSPIKIGQEHSAEATL